MNINITNRGVLQIDDARIVYRNFSGVGSQFNREGDRNFCLIIPNQEIADMLIAQGWNVKIKAPREEGDEPFMFLPVKIKFNDRGPSVYLKSGNRQNRLSEETVGMLDNIDISSVDMDIRPYDWVMYEGTKNERSGRTAYLQSILVEQEIDRFTARYSDEDEYARK